MEHENEADHNSYVSIQLSLFLSFVYLFLFLLSSTLSIMHTHYIQCMRVLQILFAHSALCRSSPTMFRTTLTAAVAVEDVDVKEEILLNPMEGGKIYVCSVSSTHLDLISFLLSFLFIYLPYLFSNKKREKTKKFKLKVPPPSLHIFLSPLLS